MTIKISLTTGKLVFMRKKKSTMLVLSFGFYPSLSSPSSSIIILFIYPYFILYRDRTYYGHYRHRMWLISRGLAHKKALNEAVNEAVNDVIPPWHEILLLLLIFICSFVWYQKGK